MDELKGLKALVTGGASGTCLAIARTFATEGAAVGVPDGIRVNAVSPGTADTPWVGKLLGGAPDPAAERAALEARQPHGRLVAPEEVAHAVLYLASPRAGSATGREVAVDGDMHGLRLRPRP
jgi:2-keto-3-deoxy-L-fuconate dehydrogenase